MTYVVISLFVVLTCASVAAQHTRRGQMTIPPLGEVRGIATHNGRDGRHVAVWYWTPPTQAASGHPFLAVFRETETGLDEVFRFREPDPGNSWEALYALPRDVAASFVVQVSEHIGDHDGDWLIARLDGQFRPVYRGAASEFADFDADGVAEIVESRWPNGDGNPTRSTIHVWDGKRYVRAGTVAWRDRFGRHGYNLVNRTSLRRTQPN